MDAKSVASSVKELVSLPRAYHRISHMLDDPRASSADIGKIISHEPALAARILRLVNSAYFNLPTRIESIPLAITILGDRSLRNLVLATSVTSAFAKISTRLVDMSDFWHHSVYCGLMARGLSHRFDKRHAEQCFLAGLLHDLGKLVIYQHLPEAASRVLSELEFREEPIENVEQEILGFTHADVGYELFKQWKLPEVYLTTTAFHHAPEAATTHVLETCLVHVADALTKKVEPGNKLLYEDNSQPALSDFVRNRVALTPELVADLRLEVDLQTVEVFATLFGES